MREPEAVGQGEIWDQALPAVNRGPRAHGRDVEGGDPVERTDAMDQAAISGKALPVGIADLGLTVGS